MSTAILEATAANLLMLTVVAAGLEVIERFDKRIVPGMRGKTAVLAASTVGSVLSGEMFGQGEFFQKFSLSLVMGCLLLACVTDALTCQVYNFVWWISGMAVVGLIWKCGPGAAILRELLLFCLIQLVLFGRMYGKADCYAFCVCAAAEAGLELGLVWFLAHMLASFLLLAAVQAVRRNISARGQLKKPVPFLPYITAAFYFILAFASWQQYHVKSIILGNSSAMPFISWRIHFH